MDQLIAEAVAAINSKALTLGLQGTLACIDIAAALASSDGKASGDRYMAWYVQHLEPLCSPLSAKDAWALRCGLLHQGRTASAQYKAVIFTLPDGRGNVLHRNVLNGALNLDLLTFCQDVLQGVQNWWNVAKDSEPVKTNATHLVRFRQEGLSPYVVGVPVLA